MARRHPFRAFNGGELTPGLYSRAELAPFQTGVAVCRNFLVQPQGSLDNRQGTEYVLETKDSSKASRLIDFEYSAGDTIAIEVGDQYMRFHTNGGTVVEAANGITGITSANPGVFTSVGHSYSVGDWLFITDILGMTELNNRYFIVATTPTADTYTLTTLDGATLNTSALTAYTGGGQSYRVYEIATPYLEADLFELHYTQDSDVMTITHPNYQQRELTRVAATNWTLTTLAFAATIAAPTNPAAVATTGSGSITYRYKVTAVSDSAALEESVASVSASCTNDLGSGTNKNTVSWTAVSGALRYRVYGTSNEGVYGYMGETEGTSFIDNNILPDTTRTPPIARDPLVGAGNYPTAVEYFDQRRIFGGTLNESQTLFATRIGLDSSFHYSIPSRDDDSIIVKLKARKVHSIRHLIPLDDLIVLTSSGAFRVDSASSDSVITPTTIRSKPSEHIGANLVQPVLTANSAHYVQSLGKKVREIRYDFASNGYESKDHSILADHLFDTYNLVDMSYSRGPTSTVWAVRSDGTLLGQTFVPEHQVAGWHRHDTEDGAGFFESVAVKQEDDEDVPYFIVKRVVDGRTVRYVERFRSRQFADMEDAFFVDSGKTYDGVATTTISNLHHLEGKTVSVLGDGAVLPQQVVTDGEITLPVSVSKAQVGLAITAQMQTLPMILTLDLSNFGDMMNINRVLLRVVSSSSVFVGPRLDKLRETKLRSSEAYGTPPNLFTGIVSTRVDGDWDEEGQIWIQQTNPLPLTVAAMLLEPTMAD